jgi:hypothetical protein
VPIFPEVGRWLEKNLYPNKGSNSNWDLYRIIINDNILPSECFALTYHLPEMIDKENGIGGAAAGQLQAGRTVESLVLFAVIAAVLYPEHCSILR